MAEDLTEAARLAQGKNPAAARSLIERLLDSNGNDADALTLLGLVEQRTGNIDNAIAAFAAARESDPENPARLVNHALALKAGRNFDAAVTALGQALSIRPDHAATMANLGSCLIAADRAAEAEPVLRRAVQIAPGHAAAWNNLGVALSRTRRYDDAILAYQRALEAQPDFPEAQLNLTDGFVALQRPAEAATIAKQVLARYPGHPRAANQLGSIYESQGRLDQAVMIWRDALHHGIHHPIGVNLARALIVKGDFQAALDLVDTLLAALPSSTTPLALKAAALDRLGRTDELASLCGLDRFVAQIEVAPPEGFATLDEFHMALGRELRSHASLTFEPEGLVTKKGRQSGDLAEANTPALAAMSMIAETAMEGFLDNLEAQDSSHPFVRAKPKAWSLTLWGTILDPGGAVEPHIHAPNWLSGVYYPGFSRSGENPDEGAFAIGTLPQTLGGGGTTRIIHPRSGLMILFPSFLWHGTLPFGGDQQRISFAFDAVPEDVGRAHKLL